MLFLGIILSWRSYISQHQQAYHVQYGMSQRLATQVNAFFKDLEHQIQLVSQVQGLMTLEPNQQYDILSELLMFQRIFEELILIDNQGREQKHVARSRLVTPDTHNHVKLHAVFRPSKDHQIVYSSVWFEASQGEPFITMAVPLFNARSGLRHGTLIAVVRMKTIWHLIAEIPVNRGQDVYIVDALNTVVAHRNPSVVLRGTKFDIPAQGERQLGLHGSQVLLAHNTVYLGDQSFTIVVEQIWSQAMTLAIHALYITLALTILMLGISGTLGFLVVRQIVRPIQTMARVAQAISDGDLSQRLPTNRRDELGLLSETFNSMTAQLRSLINGLEQRVTERTASLQTANTHLQREIAERRQTEIALHQAKDQAEAASRAKADFLATMSHEIRTPMNGVLGMTRLLLDTPLSTTQNEYADMIQRSAEALLSIINDILDFSKVESDKLDLETIDFNLRDTLEDVLELLAGQAYSKNLELACRFTSEVPTWISGDPGRLRQIVTNLVGNALKFTDQGKVIVSIDLIEACADTSLIRFEITDTGIGIAPDMQHQIFDAFSQANSSTTRKYGGTGLGLTISQRLVTLMGGTIGINSASVQGSTFWFIVPFKRCAIRRPTEYAAIPELQGVRVLCVDAHTTSRTILETQLNAWGMQVMGIDNGTTALEHLRTAQAQGQPYSLAILDDQIPDLKSEALAHVIKADPDLNTLRLMLLSTLNRYALNNATQQDNITTILAKPVRQSSLYHGLLSTLGIVSKIGSSALVEHGCTDVPIQANTCVLVVEDNVINQQVAMRVLESMGCQVEVAGTGQEAIDQLAQDTYDIVFMDCQMPEMDGFTATSIIRDREASSGCHIPIVAMTANAVKGDRERCLDAGMDDYLSKPVAFHALLAILQKWTSHPMNASRASETAAPIAPQPPQSVGLTLDTSAFDRLQAIGGAEDPHFLHDMIDMFVENAAEQIESLQAAAATGDITVIERVAHTLTSSSMQVGASRMSALCLELQTLARQSTQTSTADCIEPLVSEFDRVKQALAHELPRYLHPGTSPSLGK